MIPIIFDTNATSFGTNGYGRLSDCLSCVVTEERNGIYECEFDYPITGKWYNWLINNGGIIGVIHDDHKTIQPFDIYGYTAPINGVVTFYAHHISYRLKNVIAKPFTATSCAEVMVKLEGQTYNEQPFTFWTDKVTANEFKLDHPENVRALLGGQSGSVLDVYGKGDYEFDKWTVKLYVDRGTDSGVTIRYGKNLSDIKKELDSSNIYTAIAPYWIGSDGETVVLPEGIVYSSSVVAKVQPWTDENGNIITTENGVQIDFSFIEHSPIAKDFSDRFETAPTEEELRTAAENFLANNTTWIPKESVTVDFVQLWQTPEYEDVAALQRVGLCDRVSIFYPELGVVAENQKVIKTVYNVLLERYDSMDLGEPRTTLAQSIIDTVHNEMENMLPEVEVTRSAMEQAIEHATELITGGLGGHVVFNLNADGEPQEILIMDTDDIMTAVNVIRINQNGIGFSTDGYDGPFTTAWTIDGHFVADFITAGVLSANLIKAGILSDDAGINTWNMLTGEMNLQGNITMKNGTNYRAKMGNFTYHFGNVTNGQISQYTATGLKVAYGATDGSEANYIGLVADDGVSRIVAESTGKANTSHQRGYISNVNGTQWFLQETIDDDFTWMGCDVTNATPKFFFQIEENGFKFSNAYLPQYGYWATNIYVGVGQISLISNIQYGSSGQEWEAPFVYITNNGVHINNQNYNILSSEPGLSINRNAFVMGETNCYLKGIVSGSIVALDFCGRTVQLSSSSSRRYKQNIKDLIYDDLDPHRLLLLPVRQFEYKEDYDKLQYQDMKGKTLPGFIAEEVEAVYPSATIHHPETGEVESWDERRIIPGMLALIQEQAKKIEELEKRITELEMKK